MTPAQFRAYCALSRFNYALDSLEQEFKPLRSEMTLEAENDLEFMSLACRRFFARANGELFGKAKESAMHGCEVRNE